MDEQESQPSPAREFFLFLLELVLVALLLLACTVPAIVVTFAISPWLGVVVKLGSLRVWRQIGPPPGFLNGILCISGCVAIVEVFVGCIAVGLRDLVNRAGGGP